LVVSAGPHADDCDGVKYHLRFSSFILSRSADNFFFDDSHRAAFISAGLRHLLDSRRLCVGLPLADNSLPTQFRGAEKINFVLKLLAAVVYDILDALDMIPVIGDAVETGAAYLVARLLGVRSKWVVAGVTLEGLLPPPLDFFPAMTVGLLVDSFLSQRKRK
jgi:hypothetical protein